MNRIGIIGAMEIEVEALKAQMENVTLTKKASMEFHHGILNGKEAVVVRSGIGKVNAAVCTQILADDFQVDAVINTGIAGSLKNEINIGDIVVSTDTLQHDVDAEEFGYPKGQIPQMEVFSFAADAGLRETAVRICREVNPDIAVFEGRIVSGDQFVADAKVKEKLIREFSGFCTEMEGAAIAQAAYLNQIPFVILRAISDKADNSATMDYPAFEKKAAEHCVRLVGEMVKSL
ncbi:MAG: 5'-methylthioadenosine/adenosylhomocysteine nucleosidase [Clostridiales bacterium]|nr:5'-methylthioadenosine/adenosylhomocysteine nucleosidase [Clostridiales bacterium]